MSSHRWNADRGSMKLEVWQKTQEHFALVAKIIGKIDVKRFRLRDQIRDATHSGPSNIHSATVRIDGHVRRETLQVERKLIALVKSLRSKSEAGTRKRSFGA